MIDNFTKVVLTIIAIALMVLAVKTLQVVPMSAQAAREEVIKVNVVQIGGRPVFLSDILGK